MSTRSSDALKAEIAELEAMLSEMPTRRVIERIGLQHRLETARTELQHLPLDGKRLGLTFRGEPVEGSRSIVALFAGRALTAFSDAVATVAASLEHHLNGTGPLPGDNSERCLRVIGPALGSFGFEMEVPAPPLPKQTSVFLDDEPAASPMETAVDLTMELIDAAQGHDEEVLSDVVALVHPRAAGKVREFVETVVSGKATFSLRFNERRTALLDAQAGRRVLDALSANNVSEEEITRVGRLWVLPTKRTFEMEIEGDGILYGRVSRWLRGIENFQGPEVTATLQVLTLGAAAPRYTLLGLMPTKLPPDSETW